MQNAGMISPSLARPLRLAAVVSLVWIPLVIGASAQASAQASEQQAGLESGAQASRSALVVPQQVRYAGKLANRAGDTVEAVFRIYAAQQGGEPLWTETQRLAVGEDGSYVVLLGSASQNGLPQEVFAGGAARWLGVSVERSPELDRVMLASVPYAMKSADAEALAGHAASDFVTQKQLAQFGLSSAQAAQPETSGTVTGSGTAGTVPLWTGALTQGNSEIVQVGSDIGINEATPGATLDVNGTAKVRGALTASSSSVTGLSTAVGGILTNGNINVKSTTVATPSAKVNSPIVELTGSGYSTTSNSAVNQNFAWQTEVYNNDTATPTSGLYLLSSTGTSYPLQTGLSIASNGNITFSPSQTFPIKGTGGGTITGITTTSPLTGSGTTGSVALGLNQSALVTDIKPSLETSFNGVYAQLGAANTFSTGQTIQGASTIGGTNNESGPMLSVSNAGDANSDAIYASNGGQYGTGIYVSVASNGLGIQSYGSQSAGSLGILGAMPNFNGLSGSYSSLESADGYNAGVWADGSSGASSALIATADDTISGLFYNNSDANPSIFAYNASSGGTGLVAPRIGSVFRASGPGGMCGINQTGSLACTGQVKTLVSAKSSARQLETYTVQSAENWVEDYGSGVLNHGSATVQVEPEFAETVNTGVEFHVFLTPGGDCKGLYVTNKSAGGFEVHELGGGTSSIPFDYKIVAKRNGMESQRLVDVTGQMRIEAEAVRSKPLAHPLPRTRFNPPQHAATAVNAGAEIKR